MLKTFHSWTDHQYPDGTVIWTAPTGHTYITKPEGAHWFPALGRPTGAPPTTEASTPKPGRGLCMPTRKHTRTQERQDLVNAERARNEDRIADEVWRFQREYEIASLAAEYNDPPPF
ncbi:MAG: hypothetical protein P4L86_33040 [Mycobacterium sp.]|nr:hypothetical protein [Mycobacterium sp.]